VGRKTKNRRPWNRERNRRERREKGRRGGKVCLAETTRKSLRAARRRIKNSREGPYSSRGEATKKGKTTHTQKGDISWRSPKRKIPRGGFLQEKPGKGARRDRRPDGDIQRRPQKSHGQKQPSTAKGTVSRRVGGIRGGPPERGDLGTGGPPVCMGNRGKGKYDRRP